jgi:hypothetical protein
MEIGSGYGKSEDKIMGVLTLGGLLLILPCAVGGILYNRKDQERIGWPLTLVGTMIQGQLLLWAVFHLVCVPFILKERPFTQVVFVYGTLAGLLFVVGLICWIRKGFPIQGHPMGIWSKEYLTRVLWLIFWGLLIFQIIRVFTMTYQDGDDSYYVVIATLTEESNTMYRKLPYTGGGTMLDMRHGLAPFPVWIAFLARVSGIRTVTTAHVAVPAVLIPITYGVFALIGRQLFPGKKDNLPLFLILTEVLVLFSDYSISSPENFLIARTRQGKATLGNLVFPFLIYLLLLLFKKLDKGEKIKLRVWILICASVLTGCLCSTLGAALCGLLLGAAGLCGGICYRKWKFLLPMVLCCLPALCYGVLYIMLAY